MSHSKGNSNSNGKGESNLKMHSIVIEFVAMGICLRTDGLHFERKNMSCWFLIDARTILCVEQDFTSFTLSTLSLCCVELIALRMNAWEFIAIIINRNESLVVLFCFVFLFSPCLAFCCLVLCCF